MKKSIFVGARPVFPTGLIRPDLKVTEVETTSNIVQVYLEYQLKEINYR